ERGESDGRTGVVVGNIGVDRVYGRYDDVISLLRLSQRIPETRVAPRSAGSRWRPCANYRFGGVRTECSDEDERQSGREPKRRKDARSRGICATKEPDHSDTSPPTG